MSNQHTNIFCVPSDKNLIFGLTFENREYMIGEHIEAYGVKHICIEKKGIRQWFEPLTPITDKYLFNPHKIKHWENES